MVGVNMQAPRTFDSLSLRMCVVGVTCKLRLAWLQQGAPAWGGRWSKGLLCFLQAQDLRRILDGTGCSADMQPWRGMLCFYLSLPLWLLIAGCVSIPTYMLGAPSTSLPSNRQPPNTSSPLPLFVYEANAEHCTSCQKCKGGLLVHCLADMQIVVGLVGSFCSLCL